MKLLLLNSIEYLFKFYFFLFLNFWVFRNFFFKKIKFKVASNKNTSLKYFDLEIKRKDRGAAQTFVGIDKAEQQLLENYFKSRQVKVQMVDDKMVNKFDEDYDDEDEMEEEVNFCLFFYTFLLIFWTLNLFSIHKKKIVFFINNS